MSPYFLNKVGAHFFLYMWIIYEYGIGRVLVVGNRWEGIGKMGAVHFICRVSTKSQATNNK